MRLIIISNRFPLVTKDFNVIDERNLCGGDLSCYYAVKGLINNNINLSVITSKKAGKSLYVFNNNWEVNYVLQSRDISLNPLSLAYWLINIFQLKKILQKKNFNIIHHFNVKYISRLLFASAFIKRTRILLTVNWNGLTCLFHHVRSENIPCERCNGKNILKCFIKRPLGLVTSILVTTLRKSIIKYNKIPLICLSNFHADFLTVNGILNNKTIIEDPIDISLFTNIRKDYYNSFLKDKYKINENFKIITFIGVLSFLKGVDTLIKVIPQITCHFPNIVFLFVGFKNETYYNKLNKFVPENIITNNILFIDHISFEQMPVIYSGSDIIIVPTKYPEPSSRIIIEALASGCVISCADIGNNSEIISNGVNGFLFDPYKIDSLKKSILFLLRNFTINKNQPLQNFYNFYNHSIENVTNKTLAFYKTLF